jgi:hypothetical protein
MRLAGTAASVRTANPSMETNRASPAADLAAVSSGSTSTSSPDSGAIESGAGS